ncbi:c-type cytochrome biogenesis protein CcsB [candidate division KSB1 bacterium]|nr:c-type cytochrome biogenesis protein CcsB [candidate division KSB1 bacterium]
MLSDVFFFYIAFSCYSIAMLLYIFYPALKTDRITRVASWFMSAGIIPHTIALGYRWYLAGHAPYSNMYEYMASMSWMAVLLFIIFNIKYKKPILGVFITPITFMLMASASLMPKEISQQLMPALQSYWFEIHVSLAVLGEGAFVIAFGVSIMYLIRSHLQRSNPQHHFLSLMPNLDALDTINYKAITIGYPLFTIGALFAGAIWANEAWGTFWGWDPKETGALIVWLFYTAFLHARYVKQWQGNRAAWMSIIGFLLALASFFGNLVLGGDHAYL